MQGPNYSISSACASGNFCIQNAADHIRRGDADLMLAGSSDAAILPIGMAGFSAARALSRRNDDPATASRPWDLDRDGFVMGEGAGVLVLEELEHARARGATIYAEFLGGAYTCDAHHMTEPHPEGKGVALAIETALKSSGVARERVNYVNAHGTSTPAGDLAEYNAIRRALPGDNVRINSTKSMIGAPRQLTWHGMAWHSCMRRDLLSIAVSALTMRCCAGHLLGAAGAVEAVATIMALQTGMVRARCGVAFVQAARGYAGMSCRCTDAPYCALLPQLHPNPNLKNPDPAVDLKIVVGATAQKHAVRCSAA